MGKEVEGSIQQYVDSGVPTGWHCTKPGWHTQVAVVRLALFALDGEVADRPTSHAGVPIKLRPNPGKFTLVPCEAVQLPANPQNTPAP